VHKVFKKWLGDDYDLDALDAVLVAAAAERLTGDPLWLLVVAGPGAAKTETVQALSGAGAHVTSTITSEGALLSASPQKSRIKTATGGLLRKIGNRGILVVKDVTSILSADRNIRGTVLAAIPRDLRWTWSATSDLTAGRPSRGSAASSSSVPAPRPGTRTTPSSPRWATGSRWSASTRTSGAPNRGHGRFATAAPKRRCGRS